ncbi:unnamed protein product [Darwinula stevensoni]|uniref:NADH-ubiquinone oxidoreductase chain 4L n=1 Tax=Darwinula stevensoni TaxID=69355 RepID=A0A7R9FU64_9CRUS|nr:unnamed protein product [Darwinula stevensoni]CAG0908104.1 unnamed protein product [Darwinula stevensoni]
MGRLWYKASAIIQTPDGQFADPLPQALVLTAIVIGFATTGFVIELAIRSRQESGSDHVDGHEPGHSVAYTVEHKDDAPLQKAAMDNNKLKDGAA